MLAVACISSGLTLTAALALHEATEKQAGIRRQAVAAAHNASTAVQREISTGFARLETLATSPALQHRDFRTLYDQMKAVPLPPGTWLFLWDAEQQLLNTLRPFGERDLPRFTDFGPAAEAGRAQLFQRGQPRVSNLTRTPVAGRDLQATSVHYPVRIDGEVIFALGSIIPAEQLAAAVSLRSLPSGWLATLLDRQGNVLVPAGSLAVGDKPPAELLQQIAASPGSEELLQGQGLSGAPAMVAMSRVGEAGWTAVVEVPLTIADAPVRSVLKLLLGAGLALLAGGIAAGLALARRIERPVEHLSNLLDATRRHQHGVEARQRAHWKSTDEALFDIRVTEDGRFLLDAVNPAYERQTGLCAEAVVGRDITEVLAPQAAALAVANCRQCIATGAPVRYENLLSLPGVQRDWELILVPIHDPATGLIKSILASARDVTAQRQAERERDKALAMFRRIAETTPDLLYVYDLHAQTSVWINAQASEVLGYGKAELAAMGEQIIPHLLHPDDRAGIEAHLRRCEALPDVSFAAVDYRLRHRSGEWRWLSSRETVFARDAQGRVTHMLGCAQDVTLRRQAESAADATRDMLGRTLDALSAHVAILDNKGCILAVNAAWRRFARANALKDRDDGIGMNYLAVCEGASQGSAVAATIAAALRSMLHGPREEFRIEYACHSPHARRWFQLRAARFGEAEQRRIVMAHEDITEAREATEAVRSLAGRLLAAQDAERRRIARELHDSTAQNLLGAALALGCAGRLAPELAEEPAALLAESLDLIERTQREIRTLSYLLHPPMLDEAGLGAALEWFARGFARRSGLRITVAAETLPEELSSEAATALFRVAQEALVNVHRHAVATTAEVRMEMTGSGVARRLRLIVQDDGRARGAGKIPAEAGPGDLGVGVAGMRERLRQLGGCLNIGPAPQGGTLVQATVPLPSLERRNAVS
ncbi:PAS domain S-box protein [Teichococcus coralli]|uniref:PAS domain S-box protein n=1 Tax=Teichococcus coralli TaxID=2545983 RepID=UPI0013687D07|nr:PAS domain S-box protein [Pseudoroseomonas coralli]